MNLLNRAMNIAYFELLGDANLLNTEIEKYRAVTNTDISNYAQMVFTKENCSSLFYYSKN